MLTSLDSNGWPGTGPSWPESYTGGAGALLVYRQGANRGLQGLRFAGPQKIRCCGCRIRCSR